RRRRRALGRGRGRRRDGIEDRHDPDDLDGLVPKRRELLDQNLRLRFVRRRREQLRDGRARWLETDPDDATVQRGVVVWEFGRETYIHRHLPTLGRRVASQLISVAFRG